MGDRIGLGLGCLMLVGCAAYDDGPGRPFTELPGQGEETPTPEGDALCRPGVLHLDVTPSTGNDTLLHISLNITAAVSDVLLRVEGSAEGGPRFMDLGALPVGAYSFPLFGLYPEQSVDLEVSYRSGEKEGCDSASSTTGSVLPLGLPGFHGTGPGDDGDLVTVIPLTTAEGAPRLGWLRGEAWIGVWDLNALRAGGRRVIVDEDGDIVLLNEAFSAADVCQLISLDISGVETSRRSAALQCHHSFDLIDLQGDGEREPILLGLKPSFQVEIGGGASASVYTDQIVSLLGPAAVTILDYDSFVHASDALLNEMAEVYNPGFPAQNDATYANTLQCYTPPGGRPQCLSGLNVAETGLVHVDLGAGEVQVLQNSGLESFPLGEAPPADVAPSPLTWEGLEALSWNIGPRGGAAAMPFAGIHSAQVLDWDGATGLLRFVTHDRGFNLEAMVLGSVDPEFGRSDVSCAQTVVYALNTRTRRGAVLSVRGEDIAGVGCAQSLYTGDVSVYERGAAGDTQLTSLYTGHPAAALHTGTPAVMLRYALSAEGILTPIGAREADGLGATFGFHTTLPVDDLQLRFARRALDARAQGRSLGRAERD